MSSTDQGGIISGFAEQAAVIDYFETEWLDYDRHADDQVAHFLLTACERVRGDDGSFWRLGRKARSEVWRDTPRSRLIQARDRFTRIPDSPTQVALDQRLRQVTESPRLLSDDALQGLQVVASWFGDTDSAASIGDAQIDAELERRKLMRPLRSALGQPLIGRDETLRLLRDRILTRSAPPLVIWGVGGIGKSAVIAELLINGLPDGAAFAYLNFDRGILTARRPHALLEEILWQISCLNPELSSSDLTAVLEAVRSEGASSRGLTGTASEIQLQTVVSERLIDAVASLPELRDVPVVVVLDTYEEVQRQSPGESRLAWQLIRSLLKTLPNWTAFAAGRSRIPESDAEHMNLGELTRADAIGMLRAGVDRQRPSVVFEQVVDLVRPNPLSLRLATHVLNQSDLDDIGELLQIVDDNVQGQLYRRILDHIRDQEVQRIAHPGLVVRRIDPAVIENVLAEPCGLDLENRTAADLMQALLREATLVELGPDGALIHRADVRAVMLPALRRSDEARCTLIHTRAIDHYMNRDGMVAATEEAYHRMMIGAPGDAIEVLLDRSDIASLVASIDEMPAQSQVLLATRADGLQLPPEVIAEADDESWAAVTRPPVRSLIAAGEWVEALRIVQSRRAPDGASLLPLEEVEILEDLRRPEEALDVASAGLQRAVLRGDSTGERELTRAHVRLLERLGDRRRALMAIERLVDQWSNLSRARELDQALEELIDLTTWLRIDRLLDRSRTAKNRESIRERTDTAASEIPDRVLMSRPSLLRDLAAEVGSGRLVALATSAFAESENISPALKQGRTESARRRFQRLAEMASEPGRFFDGGDDDSPPSIAEEVQLQLRRVRVNWAGSHVFVLDRRIGYVDRHVGQILVPRDLDHFWSDLTSLPRAFAWLGGGVAPEAALIHDGLVRGRDSAPNHIGPELSRPEADRVFRDAMADLGAGAIYRWVIWSVVTLATIWARDDTSQSRWIRTYLQWVTVATFTVTVWFGYQTAAGLSANAWPGYFDAPWVAGSSGWTRLLTSLASGFTLPLILSGLWGRFWRAGAIVGIIWGGLLSLALTFVSIGGL